jgi:ribosomal 50S subunit-recycling heat shock protein
MKVEKPGHVLKAGDVLTLCKGANIVAVRVLALAERRGSAAEARTLYQILN